ncbi:MAG: HAD hydrolase-like protein [Actinomycetota bacterium]
MKPAALILDFDGPVADAFHDLPTEELLERSHRLLIERDWSPSSIPDDGDALTLVQAVHRIDPAEGRALERMISEVEASTIPHAPETPGAVELIRGAMDGGVAVAVASNNSSRAIRSWLDGRSLGNSLIGVVARTNSTIGLMKPEPAYLLEVAVGLCLKPSQCAFVGDSLTDAVAARRANMPFVAYANRPYKNQLFMQEPHLAQVDEMAGVRSVLQWS